MTGLTNDLRLTFRRFRKNPGFTVAIVLTLALGISFARSPSKIPIVS
jgi:hypothetical protein